MIGGGTRTQPLLFLQLQGLSARGPEPLLFGRVPLPVPPPLVISGQTLDSTSTPLASCRVEFFRTANDTKHSETTSDGSGNYTSDPVGLGQQYYAVAYKAGSPDVAGTTVNTLTGT